MPGFEGSFQQYDCVADTHHGVSMRDGSVLYADVYRPALSGQAVEGKWPVLLERTPYNKDRLSYSVSGRYFAKRGYVYVVQDVRGRWSSDGDFAFLRNEGGGIA